MVNVITTNPNTRISGSGTVTVVGKSGQVISQQRYSQGRQVSRTSGGRKQGQETAPPEQVWNPTTKEWVNLSTHKILSDGTVVARESADTTRRAGIASPISNRIYENPESMNLALEQAQREAEREQAITESAGYSALLNKVLQQAETQHYLVEKYGTTGVKAVEPTDKSLRSPEGEARRQLAEYNKFSSLVESPYVTEQQKQSSPILAEAQKRKALVAGFDYSSLRMVEQAQTPEKFGGYKYSTYAGVSRGAGGEETLMEFSAPDLSDTGLVESKRKEYLESGRNAGLGMQAAYSVLNLPSELGGLSRFAPKPFDTAPKMFGATKDFGAEFERLKEERAISVGKWMDKFSERYNKPFVVPIINKEIPYSSGMYGAAVRTGLASETSLVGVSLGIGLGSGAAVSGIATAARYAGASAMAVNVGLLAASVPVAVAGLYLTDRQMKAVAKDTTLTEYEKTGYQATTLASTLAGMAGFQAGYGAVYSRFAPKPKAVLVSQQKSISVGKETTFTQRLIDGQRSAYKTVGKAQLKIYGDYTFDVGGQKISVKTYSEAPAYMKATSKNLGESLAYLKQQGFEINLAKGFDPYKYYIGAGSSKYSATTYVMRSGDWRLAGVSKGKDAYLLLSQDLSPKKILLSTVGEGRYVFTPPRGKAVFGGYKFDTLTVKNMLAQIQAPRAIFSAGEYTGASRLNAPKVVTATSGKWANVYFKPQISNRYFKVELVSGGGAKQFMGMNEWTQKYLSAPKGEGIFGSLSPEAQANLARQVFMPPKAPRIVALDVMQNFGRTTQSLGVISGRQAYQAPQMFRVPKTAIRIASAQSIAESMATQQVKVAQNFAVQKFLAPSLVTSFGWASLQNRLTIPKVAPITIPKVSQNLIPKGMTRLGVSSAVMPMVSPVTVPKTVTIPKTTTRLIAPIVPIAPAIPRGAIPIPMFPTVPPTFNFDISFGQQMFSTKPFGGRQPRAYTPSIAGLAFNVRRKAKKINWKQMFTGLEIRPIPIFSKQKGR